MKKILFALLLMVAYCATGFAYDACIDGIYYNFSDNGATVTYLHESASTNKSAYTGEIVIPSQVTYNGKEYSVTHISKYAFGYCSGMTSVTIPQSVTDIGSNAFSDCSGLTSVHISDISAWCKISFSSINSNPLYYARHLILNGTEVKDVVIPDDAEIIHSYAFYRCSGLTSVTIPSSVTSIGCNAFQGCKSLTSVTIPSSVTSIGSSAFQGCRSLASVTIPNSVTSIYSSTFQDCQSLTSVTIPSSVTRIYEKAFSGCSLLASVTIPSSVTSVREGAFSGTAWFNNQPDGLIYINRLAYEYKGDMPKNTTVKIKDGTQTINDRAFYGCSGLTSVTIPNSVTSIGSYAFFKCSGLTSVTIPNSVTTIDWQTFQGCSGLKSVTIPNSVTTIGYCAFYGCNNLEEVYCNAVNMPKLDSYAFDCGGYKKLYVPDESVNLYANAEEWNMFGTILGLHGTEPEPAEAPTGMTFSYITAKKSAVLTRANTSLSGKIRIPHKITYKGETYSVVGIGNSAFSGCRSLTSVAIPNSVTSIGEQAFYECKGLTSMIIPNSVSNIDRGTFRECSYLRSVSIPNSVTSIGSDAFYRCWSLSSVTIPNSVTSIGSDAFYGCSNLRSVTIPNSVTFIGYSVFQGCSSLTSVTIPNSVTIIGYSAFNGCSSLSSVSIPNSVTSIDFNAFYGCKGLTTVELGSSVRSIYNKAFANCENLKDVYSYAVKVPSMGTGVFEGSLVQYATLHAPQESLDLYKQADQWKDFGTILFNVGNKGKELLQAACNALTPYTDGWGTVYYYSRATKDQALGLLSSAETLLVSGSSEECEELANKINQKVTEIQAEIETFDSVVATPVIDVVDGKLVVTCSTEGATITTSAKLSKSETTSDANGVAIGFQDVITISAYATVEGLQKSETAKRKFPLTLFIMGDMNGDGKLTVVDVTKLVEKAGR